MSTKPQVRKLILFLFMAVAACTRRAAPPDASTCLSDRVGHCIGDR